MNDITIGRSNSSVIVVDKVYDNVSSHHAVLHIQGNSLIFEDCSRNGSYVDGKPIHNGSVPVAIGTPIVLAGKYQLDWNLVRKYMASVQGTQPMGIGGTIPNMGGMPSPAGNVQGYGIEPNCIRQFNWGAFLLNWIWAVGNGVYWGLLALIPGVNFIVAFVLGFSGNEQAWRVYQGSASSFETKQKSWTKAGIIVWSISLGLTLLSFAIIGIAYLM